MDSSNGSSLELKPFTGIAIGHCNKPPPLPGSVKVPDSFAPDEFQSSDGIILSEATTDHHVGCQIDELVVFNLKMDRA